MIHATQSRKKTEENGISLKDIEQLIEDSTKSGIAFVMTTRYASQEILSELLLNGYCLSYVNDHLAVPFLKISW